MEAVKGWTLAAILAVAGCQSVDVEGTRSGDGGGQDEVDEGEGSGGPEGGDQGTDEEPPNEGGDEGAGDFQPGEAAGGAEGGGEDDCAAVAQGGLNSVAQAHVRADCADYAGLAADPDSPRILKCFVDYVGATDPLTLSTAHDQLAFWLNTYNALVITAVLAGLVEDPGFSTAGADRNTFDFFNKPKYRVGGTLDLSLDEIEHQIIRGVGAEDADPKIAEWHAGLGAENEVTDARIHAALNCAARSCPALPAFAFTGTDLDGELDARVSLWLGDASKGAGPNGVSSLFTWFKADFEAFSGSVREFVASRRPGGADGVDFDTALNYNWDLNSCP